MSRIEITYKYHYGSSISDGSIEVVLEAFDDEKNGCDSFVFPIDPRLSRALFILKPSILERALKSCGKYETMENARKHGLTNRVKRITGEIDKGTDTCWLVSLYRHCIRSLVMTLIDNDIDLPFNFTEKEIERFNLGGDATKSSPLNTVSFHFNVGLKNAKKSKQQQLNDTNIRA